MSSLRRIPSPDTMSQSKLNDDDAEGNAPAREYKQTTIGTRDKEHEEEKQGAGPSSAHVPPAMRAYRHALESIFSMLELSDLIQILAVSRSFAAAVRSMSPIPASISRVGYESLSECRPRPFPPIERIVGSSLLRHLAAIEIDDARGWTPLNSASLGLLASHAPNLQSLSCALTLTPNEPLILPAKLQSLQLRSFGHYSGAALNGMLTAVAALPSLSRLRLQLAAFDSDTTADWSLLDACRSLTHLTLKTPRGGAPKLSDTQVEQTRAALGQLRRLSLGQMDSAMIARLLQPPVTARWQDIGRVRADTRAGELLLRLPSLTALDLWYAEPTARVEFLSDLKQLTSLQMDCYNPDHNDDDDDDGENAAWFVPADVLLASLVLCKGITELTLTCGFDSAHWSALFDKLALQKLTIRRGALETLRCFAEGPITQSLEQLTLHSLALLPSEVAHLRALRRLRILRLVWCFSPRLAAVTLDSLSPPSSVLPALTELSYRGWTAEDSGERRGPSFDWLQQR